MNIVWTGLNESLAGVRPEPPFNQLLSRLLPKARDAFVAKCELVELELNEVVAQPGGEIRDVYFPVTCYFSQLQTTAGSTIEVTMTGREGMVGLPLVLGITRSSLTINVQGSGSALRMDAGAFTRELRENAALRVVLGKYTHVSLTQAALSIACARFHTVEQRLARWLLLTSDRARSPSFQMTQRMLAHLMGVRRVGVTNAACVLQDKGLVRYTRGALRILDMGGLHGIACSCHRDEVAVYARTFGDAASE